MILLSKGAWNKKNISFDAINKAKNGNYKKLNLATHGAFKKY